LKDEMKISPVCKSAPLSTVLALSYLITIAGLSTAVLLTPGLCLAAGFDCNRATTRIEKLICADRGLSQLDESLSKTYREVLRSAPDPGGLKREQNTWLREVRDLCPDGVCLEKEYRNRIAALEKLSPVTIAGEKSAAPAGTSVEPLRIIKETSEYRPADYQILLWGYPVDSPTYYM
jgi:uncharacterized protein